MNARDVIADAIKNGGRAVAENKALFVIDALQAAGFTIMSKEDVEAIREKALEEAAIVSFHVSRLADKSPDDIAAAIRSLKSKPADSTENAE